MTASSPYAPPRRNAFLKHHAHRDPRSIQPRLPVRREQQTSLVLRNNKLAWSVGVLCLVIQCWPSKTAFQSHHRRGVAVLNTIRRHLRAFPQSFQPLVSAILVWIEQRLDSAVRRLLPLPLPPAAAAPCQALALPAPHPLPPSSSEQQQQQDHLRHSDASASGAAACSVLNAHDGQDNNDNADDDVDPPSVLPLPSSPPIKVTPPTSNGSSTPSEILVPTPNRDNRHFHHPYYHPDETDDAQETAIRLFLSGSDDGLEDHHHSKVEETTALMMSSSLSLSAASFRTNQYWIHKVLTYWFASHSGPEQAQRQLWMVPSQSPHRSKVDQEIFEQFGELLVQLAWNDHDRFTDWTGCPITLLEQQSLGGESSTRHGSHISSCHSHGHTEETEDDHNEDHNTHDDLYGYQGKLAAIIVLDQFSRHIIRHMHQQEEKYTTPITTNAQKRQKQQQRLLDLPEQSVLDDLAYETAQLLVNRHAAEMSSGMIPTPMHVFAMMPFRHNNTVESVQYVQEQIQQMDQMVLQDCNAMVRRFRKATNRRLAVLQDEQRRGGGHGDHDGGHDDFLLPQDHDHHDPHNYDKTKFTDEEILECTAFNSGPTCMSTSRLHPVHQTICSFLRSRGVHPICKSNANTPTRIRNKKNAGTPTTTTAAAASSSAISDNSTPISLPTPIVLSLSGGVDSMVIASVLAYLTRECNYHLHITAVHIDYGNRPESAAEADFVRRYCHKLLGTGEGGGGDEGTNASSYSFLCRRIDEVTRGVTARDEYEKVSRQVRYDMYRQAVQEARKTTGRTSSSDENDHEKDEIGVVLGHHRGDLRENVLSNAHRGCGPLDLSGMTAVSGNDGVTLYRPLLPLEKSAIYDYAHKFGVPYFKDTTPHWSTRGKLRNKLLPLLEEIYGEGSMNNLSNLAVESDACRDLVHSIAFTPFLDQVKRRPMGITFATAPWKNYDLFFWKFMLRETLHISGLGMFSDKCVVSFLERVQAQKVVEGWLQCRKDYGTYLQQDGHVSIFYPASFPWGSDDYGFKHAGQTVGFGPENAVQVGPWRVTASTHAISDELETTDFLALKAVLSVDSLMEGRVEYYIKARTWKNADGTFTPKPLVFTCFTKATRPLAWKNADNKLQQKLPLPGSSQESLSALKDPFGCGAVHMSDNGDYVENPVVLVKVSLQLEVSAEPAVHVLAY